MRAPVSSPLPVVVTVLVLGACSNGPHTAPVPDDGSVPPTVSSYTPAGCAYTLSIPANYGLTDFALDEAQAASDPGTMAPERVRLGMGGSTVMGKPGYADPTTTAAFVWETAGAFHSAKVRMGLAPTSLGTPVTGFSYTGTGGSNFHEVHVCGLTPGTTYYYEVGGGAAGAEVWSATQMFTTVPTALPITVGVNGDARDSSTVYQLVNERMRDAAPAMQIFTGDLVLLGGVETAYQQWLDAIWKDPSDATKFLTLGQQMILSIGGNHEAQTVEYYANIALPADGPFAESFGSFTLGSVHFVLLDDQAVSGLGTSGEAAAQLAWLDQDLTLAEADRANHPFIVVAHHRGEFSTSEHSIDSDVIAMKTALVPVWDKHHVDLVLNGHDHNYERSNPVTGPVSNPVVQSSSTMGTTYVVCAGAGASAYTPGTNPAPYRAKNVGFGTGTPYVGVYALLKVDVHTLTMTVYGLKSAGGSVAGDDVIDTFTLTR